MKQTARQKSFLVYGTRGRVLFSLPAILRQLSVVSFIISLAFATVFPVRTVLSAGLDTVTVTLAVETVNVDSQVTVAFPIGGLSNGEVIKIYLGENSTGDEWQLDAITTSDVSCTDNGTGETYTVNSITAASATVPMWTQITATTVGSGASTVTCLIGDGATDDPKNPISADGYSVAVITTEDGGAGIAYVGNANDITVSATVLPNLALTIDGADATSCVTTSGVTACNLGIVTTAAVNTGYYDVNVGTNATNGATLSIAENQDLTSGSDVIDDLTEDIGGTVTAGAEEYGIAVTSDAAWTEAGNFNDDDTPIPSGPASVATTTGPIDITGNDVTVTHRVAVASTTESGSFSHIVTWTATADF